MTNVGHNGFFTKPSNIGLPPLDEIDMVLKKWARPDWAFLLRQSQLSLTWSKEPGFAHWIGLSNIDMEGMDHLRLFENCHLCPRDCGVNRSVEGGSARAGFCREGLHLRVAHVGPHFGEEPPITGKNGSGTIFFTGCSLRCTICQNYQISRDGVGKPCRVDELSERVLEMIRVHQVHNINFVTPDHFFPYTFQLVTLLRKAASDPAEPLSVDLIRRGEPLSLSR
jgi:uncharacterized Fe-S radical SAM superfamily protein PflX